MASCACGTAAWVGWVLVACGAAAAPPESYRKLWRDPAVEARIGQGIERHRKGELAVEVVDAGGKPVPGATVVATQKSHDFLFGCNAFVLGQLEGPGQNRKYEEAFLRLFNFATVPFYWEGTEPERGELRYGEEGSRDIWRRPPPDRYLPWAAKHGVTLKGHPLLWHAYNPPWLPSDAGELKELYRKRFREIAGRYGGKIGIWDVVNESLVCKTNYPLYTPGREYVRWAFEEAAPLFPESTTLMINEVTTPFNFLPADNNPYFAQVKSLLGQGAKIRGIGFQYHYFRREKLDAFLADPKCDPNRLLDVYGQFGEFGLPLYVTEITFPSAGEGGEALQEEVVRDHYRLWFSAPRMAGITWWNLGDGTAVKGENEAMGGLLDANFEPKAAYRALDRLINGEWKTRAECRADERGVARFRGFFGNYDVEISGGGARQKFQVKHSQGQTGPIRLVMGQRP
ncbi:MAG: endo-1,4-beta-xylanase [Verrucomicrobiae bacterium]|nr:endo-1,4-beta-xylanase [Verrucomicrobiae bacterium]